MTKPALKAVETRSPARTALAEAIWQVNAWKRESDKLQEGLARAEDEISEQNRLIEGAAAAVEEAKAQEKRNLMAELTGSSTGSKTSTEGAVAKLEKQNTRLGLLRSAKDEFASQLSNANDEIKRWKSRVAEAAVEVAKADPAIANVIAEMQAATDRYAELFRIMTFFWKKDLLPNRRMYWGVLPGGYIPQMNSELPADSPWHAAVAALHTDPDAHLPTVSLAPAGQRLGLDITSANYGAA